MLLRAAQQSLQIKFSLIIVSMLQRFQHPTETLVIEYRRPPNFSHFYYYNYYYCYYYYYHY